MDDNLPGPCPTCFAAHGPGCEHCQSHHPDLPAIDPVTYAECRTDVTARIPACRLIGGPRHRLPAWWYTLLLGDERGRLDIVLEGSQRVGITIDGIVAMDAEHDVLRHPDGRFEIIGNQVPA